MKDLSFYLLKNSFGSKMKKGFKNFCNGDGSTTTLNQQKIDQHGHGDHSSSCTTYLENDELPRRSQPTLEEMILRLDLEEKLARRAKLDEYSDVHHRMSCVNSSDILRSARNALNQYPRFSLDGKDAMYRSSFRNFDHVNRKSVGVRKQNLEPVHKSSTSWCLPAKVGGESVVWCKPGVVGKLMGLDAMPIPLHSRCHKKQTLKSIARKQNLRRSSERQEMEGGRGAGRKGGEVGSCSTNTNRFCVMKPMAVKIADDEAGWQMRRFL